MTGQEAEGWPGGLCSGPEHVVPIVVGRAKALDGGMQGDHGASHGVTGGVGIEAAVDLAASVQQWRQPARVGPGARGGEAPVSGMEGKAEQAIPPRHHRRQTPRGRSVVSGI